MQAFKYSNIRSDKSAILIISIISKENDLSGKTLEIYAHVQLGTSTKTGKKLRLENQLMMRWQNCVSNKMLYYAHAYLWTFVTLYLSNSFVPNAREWTIFLWEIKTVC
jgi:hypothetical protein